MATKSRHLKTPLQLWIADNRKRLGLTPADLARMTDVSEATVRAWESRGRPSEDALVILERRFGKPRPDDDGQAVGSNAEIVAAIDRQTAAIEAQTRMLALVLSRLGGTPADEVGHEDADAAIDRTHAGLQALPRGLAPVEA